MAGGALHSSFCPDVLRAVEQSVALFIHVSDMSDTALCELRAVCHQNTKESCQNKAFNTIKGIVYRFSMFNSILIQCIYLTA